MGVHDFTFRPKTSQPVPSDEKSPLVPQRLDQHTSMQPKTEITHDTINVEHTDVNEHDILGFRVFDEAIKNWLTDLFSRIPTKSSGPKSADVIIAGADRSYLLFNQDISVGRIKLPVVTVDRMSASRWENEFSPPHHHLRLRYTDCSRTVAKKIYRPAPYLLEYNISWWTENKRDAEWMLYELIPRFHPLCEIEVEDTQWRGPLTMRCGDWKDSSDKTIASGEKEFKKYELPITAEAWLPLPDQVVKTVVGNVTSMESYSAPDNFSESFNNDLNWASGIINF